MARQDWMRGQDERRDWRERDERGEPAYRDARDDRGGLPRGPRNDFGQADYSSDYRYDPERRAGYRAEERPYDRDDYGQADYSTDYAYDPDRGRGYRRFGADDRAYDDREDYSPDRDLRDERLREDEDERPSWRERAGAFFGGGGVGGGERESRRRRGPSDRVLWAVIVERLEDARGIDLRDLEVLVEDAEVTLNGTVRRREDKRRIEDIADIDGVRNVQNNLRVRERRWFS